MLTGEFSNLLRDLVIPKPVLDRLGDAVLQSDRTEHAAHEQAVKRLQTRLQQIQARTETMYLDKLEGRINQEFFDKQAARWRDEQDALLRKIRDIQDAAPTPVDQAIDMMGLMSQHSNYF